MTAKELKGSETETRLSFRSLCNMIAEFSFDMLPSQLQEKLNSECIHSNKEYIRSSTFVSVNTFSN